MPSWGWFFFFLTFAQAHTVDQVFLELRPHQDGVTGMVMIDAAYCLPEYRGQDDAQAPGRQWLLDKTDEEHQYLRDQATTYLQETLSLMVDEQPFTLDFSFPDYEKTPYDFPKSLIDKALIRINVKGSFPKKNGPLQIKWSDPFQANLVINLPVQGTEEQQRYLEVRPRSAMDIGWEVSGQEEIETPVEKLPLEKKETRNATWGNILTFTKIGFDHILPKGLDHILFIAGLFLFMPKWQPLLKQSLTFTVAHSITLAIVTLGWVVPPMKWVEVLIALSIAYVGIENLFTREIKPWRLIIIFAFGLLHGMGFAAVFSDYLPENQLVLPLISFNVGVELGQIVVLLACFLVFGRFRNSFKWIRLSGSLIISGVALYWVVERALS